MVGFIPFIPGVDFFFYFSMVGGQMKMSCKFRCLRIALGSEERWLNRNYLPERRSITSFVQNT